MSEPSTWASKSLFLSPASCVAFCQQTKWSQISPMALFLVHKIQPVSYACCPPPSFKHCITLCSCSPTFTSAKFLLSHSRSSPLHNGHAIKIIEEMNTTHFPALLPLGPATHSFQAALPPHKNSLFRSMEECSPLSGREQVTAHKTTVWYHMSPG